MVPGNNSECVLAQGQTASLRCVVYVPRDESNNTVGTVKWYRSIDLITSVNITNEYIIQRGASSSEPFSSGRFAGLYKDTYILLIRNISSSDSGYYWCQIITNETCSSPSPYVNISVSTVSTDQDALILSVDYGDNPVCANVTTCDLQSTPATVVPMATTSFSSEMVSISSGSKICMTQPDVKQLEFVACLGVTVPTAGFVLILMISFICCAGICVYRKKKKQKGEFT